MPKLWVSKTSSLSTWAGPPAKSALVENGRFSVNSVYYVALRARLSHQIVRHRRRRSRLRRRLIAWLDSQKRLHVGPQSAGSTPGPVCYGRGGGEPTITDANLVLGRLNADNFLGGEMKLDVNAASGPSRNGSPSRWVTLGATA